MILATSVLETLHRAHPNARIDLLVRKGVESLFSDHPYLHALLIWDKQKGKYSGLFRMLLTIRQQRYDAVINLHRFGSSGLLTAFSGAGQRVGFRKNPLSRFFTRRVSHKIERTWHEIDRNHQLIEPFVSGKPARPRLYPRPQDVAHVRRDRPYICVAPATIWRTKQYPMERWAALIDRLPIGYEVLLIGGKADHALCETIRKSTRHPQVVNLAGSFQLLESAALIARAAMTYANDSAPVHLASAMNAPVALLYCSTAPVYGFTPLSERHHIVESSLSLPCRPCGIHGHRACPEGHSKCAEFTVPDAILPPALPT